MRSMPGWLVLLGSGAAAAACTSSTAPPSPSWPGSWSVTTSVLDQGGALGGTIQPTPFLLKITPNGNALQDTFPTLKWMQMTGGSWTFPPGEPSDAIVGHADTLLWRVYSTPDGGGKTCTLVFNGLLVGSDSVRGSVLVSGTATACAAANGGTWAGKRQ